MAVPFDDTIKELMAEYETARGQLANIQKEAQAVSGKARSKSRMLSVVVDGEGAVTELKFHNQTWRTMSPGELSKVIVQTINEAQQNAREAAWAVHGSFLPPGVSANDLALGKLDWSAATPEDIGLPDIIKEFLTEFDGEAK